MVRHMAFVRWQTMNNVRMNTSNEARKHSMGKINAFVNKKNDIFKSTLNEKISCWCFLRLNFQQLSIVLKIAFDIGAVQLF